VAEEPLTILIDYRERCGGVAEELVSFDMSIEFRGLEVADYLVGERVGAERKTVRDLHRSIADRRLWRQVAALRADLLRSYLIVEGERIDAGPISRPGIRSSLLAVANLGVIVVRSRSPSDTALWLWRMAVRHQRTTPKPVSRSLPRGLPATPRNILSTLPGMSAVTAERLLDEFGSIAAIGAAKSYDLQRVAGVGPRRAQVLLEILAGECSS